MIVHSWNPRDPPWIASQRGLVYALGDLSGGFQWKIPSLIEIILKLVNLLPYFWLGNKQLHLNSESSEFFAAHGVWCPSPIILLGHFNPAVTAAVAPWPLDISHGFEDVCFHLSKHKARKSCAYIFTRFFSMNISNQGVRTFFSKTLGNLTFWIQRFLVWVDVLPYPFEAFFKFHANFRGCDLSSCILHHFHIAPAKGDWSCLLSLHLSSHKRPTCLLVSVIEGMTN